jgi:hypothetical protein
VVHDGWGTPDIAAIPARRCTTGELGERIVDRLVEQRAAAWSGESHETTTVA